MKNNIPYLICITLACTIIYLLYNRKERVEFRYLNKNYSLTEDIFRKSFGFSAINNSDSIIQEEFNTSDLNDFILKKSSAFNRFAAMSPGRDISIEEARTLISNYQIKLEPKLPRSVYFSLEHIIKKIDSLIKDEKFFKGANYSNFGIRTYFGKYGKNCTPFNCTDIDLSTDCENQNTIFIELTYDSNLADNDRSNPAIYNPRGDGRNITDISDSLKLNIKYTLRNVGGLCPPNCPDNQQNHDKVLYPPQ